MNDPVHDVADLLLAIEAEMRSIALWESSPPPTEAVESLQPFCYDTLEFHQWIQWVMLPKMKTLIEANMALPTTSDIHPLAEMQLAKLSADTDHLLRLLLLFDETLNRASH